MIVNFGSHRARDKALQLLDRKLQGYYSFYRGSTGGYYAVSEPEFAALKAAKIPVTRLRSGDDLHLTWAQDGSGPPGSIFRGRRTEPKRPVIRCCPGLIPGIE